MALLLFLLFCNAIALHFDYATIAWNLVSGTAGGTDPRTYNFSLTEGFEYNFGWDFPPTLGNVLSWSSSSYTDQRVFFLTAMPDPGTANANKPQFFAAPFETAVNLNPGEGWVIGQSNFQLTISDNLADNWRWEIIDGNRHFPSMDNNANIAYRFTGVLNRWDTHSIHAYGGIPNVKFDLNKLNLFLIPTINIDDEVHFYKFATSGESLLNTVIPAEPGSGGVFDADDFTDPQFRLNRETGLVSWTPNTVGNYSVQFIIEKNCTHGSVCLDSVNQADCCSRTIFDVLLKVVDPAFDDPAQAPQFVSPFPAGPGGGGSSPLDRIINVVEGEPYSGPICVNKAGAQLAWSDLPPGFTVVPAATSPAGQTCWTLHWDDPEKDSWVCFRAYDPNTQLNSHGQYCILFKVKIKVVLQVWNLPKIDFRPGIFAFPSSPGRTADYVVIQIVQKNNQFYPGAFKIQHKVGMKTDTAHTFGPIVAQPTNKDRDAFFNFTVPWDVADLGLHSTKISWGETARFLGGEFYFNSYFHVYVPTGRFCVPFDLANPTGLTQGKTYTMYGWDWETQGGKISPAYNIYPDTRRFYGFSKFASSTLKNGYTQAIQNNPNGADAYWAIGAPVVGRPNTQFSGASGPDFKINKFAIVNPAGLPQTSAKHHYPVPTANSGTVTAGVWGTYQIDPTRFKPLIR